MTSHSTPKPAKYLLGLAVAILFVVFITVTLNRSSNPTNLRAAPAENSYRVYIGNFNEVDNSVFDSNIQDKIEKALYSKVVSISNNLYTGMVQPDSSSIKKIYTPSGNMVIKTLRVNVEPIKMSYTVSIRDFMGVQALDVSCAPINYQMDKTVECKGAQWGL